MMFHILLYLTPLAGGLLIPWWLATKRSPAWLAGGLAAWLGLLAVLGAGVAVAYLAVLLCFYATLYLAMSYNPLAAQIVTSLVVVLMNAIVFCANPLIESAQTSEAVQRTIAGIGEISPMVVLATLTGDDLFHGKLMYQISRIADYGLPRPDAVSVGLRLAIASLVFLALWRLPKIISRRNGSP